MSDELKAMEPRDPKDRAKLFERSEDELGRIAKEINNYVIQTYDLNKPECVFIYEVLGSAIRSHAVHQILKEAFLDAMIDPNKETPQ